MGDRDLHDPYGFEKFHGETQQIAIRSPVGNALFRKPGNKFCRPDRFGQSCGSKGTEALKRRRRLTEAQNTRVIVEYSTSGILDTM